MGNVNVTEERVELTAIDKASAVFEAIEGRAKSLGRTYDGLKTAFVALTTGSALWAWHEKLQDAQLKSEVSANRLTAVIRATGDVVGLTRQELESYARSLSDSTQFTAGAFKAAETNLLKFGNIHGDVFRQALKLSADYASFTGGDLVDATQMIGKALSAPAEGTRALEREVGKLNFTTKERIESLLREGQVTAAQNVVLDVLRSKIGGTAEVMNTGLLKATVDLDKAWDELLKTAAKTTTWNTALGVTADLLRDIRGIISGGPSESNGLSLMLQDISDRLSRLPLAGNPIWLGAKIGQNLLPGRGPTVSGRIDFPPGTSPGTAEASASSAGASQAAETDRIREAWTKALPVVDAWNLRLMQMNGVTEEQIARLMVLDRIVTKNGMQFAVRAPHGDMPSGAKVDILNTALELDRRRQNIERITIEYGALTHLIEAKQAENDLALRAFMQDRQQVEGLQLEIDLIGKTTYEQQQLTAARQIDLQTKQRTYEALATLPEDASADEIDRIVRAYRLAADRQKGIVSDLLRTRREAERSWETGSRDAFKSYVDNATNAAEAARTVFTDAFRGMEDALVEFVKTGKFNFKDLVNTIETDLIRIGVRQAITVPLANAVGPGFGALGGLFGFGAGAGAGALAMGGGAVPLTAEEAFLSGSAPAAASFSWLPPIAAGAGLAYAYQSGVANQSFPIFGKLGNAIDSVFPGVGSLLGMGGGRGPKNPQMGLLEQPGGGFYIGQMNSGDDAFAQSSIAPLIAQINDRTKYDQAMLHQLVGYMSGSVGTSPDQMLAMLMQRLSSAALPDLGALESQQTALYRQLMGVANPDALGITGLQRYQEALSVSDLAGGPMDRLGSARSIYDSTLARARAGDLSAINQFPQVAQQLLGIGRDVYASGSGFQDLFVGVNQALNEVLDHQRSLQADLLKDVPASIQQASIDQVKAIRDQTTALSDELKAVQEELRRVRNAIAA